MHFTLLLMYTIKILNTVLQHRLVTGFALLLLCCSTTYGQVPGCTDPLANNFNASATVNNGSCTYTSTSYTPLSKVNPISNILVESSGLQWADNSLWSFNDGGGAAAIYRIDTLSNAIYQTVYLQGASNIDWEDIAFDGVYFYIGDVGNNANGARTDLTIYKFPLAAIPAYQSNPVVTIPAAEISRIYFTYNDQPQPPVATGSNYTAFDCEAMLVDEGKIHLFTKNWINVSSTHYVIPSVEAGTYTAMPLETLQTNYLVTGADKAMGNKVITLLGYQNSGTALHFMHLLSSYSGGYYFNGNKRRLDLPNVTTMGQAEGICFRNGYYGYISNEKFVKVLFGNTVTIYQQLKAFDISQLVSDLKTTYIFWGNGFWNMAGNWTDGLMPPPTLAPNSQVIIDPLPGGECVLNIPYTLTGGTPLIINNGKKLLIAGNLILQ